MKPEKTVLPRQAQLVSSAFALSVTELPGTSETTQPVTGQAPAVTTQPVSTPLQPTGSPVGTEVAPTTEALTHPSSSWTPVATQGPRTPFPTWTFSNYKVILAEDGMRKPRLRGSPFL